MGDTTDNLKTVAQIRKAILPLVSMVKRDSDEKLEKRLQTIEVALEALLKKDTSVNVQPPEVNVTVDTSKIEASLNKLQKSEPAVASPSPYEPHDQAKSSPYQYSGFVNSDGNWYIQRVAKGEQRYAKGSSDYKSAWAKKSELKYGYING